MADIHANLPALEAVLRDVESRSVDLRFHLGDLVGYGAWPNEVVELLRDSEIHGVSGNYDSTVAARAAHCGCRAENADQEARNQVSYNWTVTNVTAQTRAFLAALPFRLDVRPLGGHRPGPRMILVHGTPTLNTLYWTEDRPAAFCMEMAAKAGARAGDAIVCGHTHKPWQREIEGIRFVNGGSVGKPKDGDPRACYAIVSFVDAHNEVEFIRVDYDVSRAAAAVRGAGLPDAFARALETGTSI